MRISVRLAAVSLALTLWSLVGAAADPTTPPAQEAADRATQSKPAESKQTKTPARGAGEQAPGEGFTPSETISADSAVSFPVDI